VLQAGVAIDRATRTGYRGSGPEGRGEGPRRGGALWTEQRAVATFEAELEALQELSDAERELLSAFWAWLSATGLSVGRRKSAGAGWFDVRVEELPERPRRATVLGTPSTAARQRYACRITLLEPAHLVGPRQRDFYRDSLDVIPASTLRGAIGRAIERSRGGDLARALFLSERSVLVGPAFAVRRDAPPGMAVPWLSRRRCRGGEHVLDLALYEIAAALGGGEPPARCPRCGAPLKRDPAPSPPVLPLGHTAIEPATRRAARGQLHYQVALAPGTTFEARLLATAGQAAVIAELDEVFIGGRSARGMGRARLELVDLGAPREEDLERAEQATHKALRDLGVDSPPPLLVLGLESDADPGEPLAELLKRRALAPVAGEVRRVERGGWDELQGSPRSLRSVLQAGSWIAVRWDGEEGRAGVLQLAQEGLPDPQEICPLIVSVRMPEEEVEEMVESTRSEPASAAAERDRLVQKVRELCRRHARELPKRAQLHNLLRYAQQTDSVEEVALFFEYQATRPDLRKHAGFLRELAQEVRNGYRENPEGLRDYLALVVRAADVERPENGGEEA
jgi:CRISPR-associated Cas5-like protein